MRIVASSLVVLGCLLAARWHNAFTTRAAEPTPRADNAQPPAKGPANQTSAARTKGKPRFTVGKQTTYVTGPLDKAGYVDYATALNERLGRGVTPADNANVLIFQAVGSHPSGTTVPAEFFRWLGMKPPPERGDYFVDLSAYLKAHNKLGPDELDNELSDEWHRCVRRPWKAPDHPDFAAWLKANEKPLALAVQASRRPRYFSPLVPATRDKGPGSLPSALMSAVHECRGLADALAARAMLRVGEGRPDDARQDLLACHRLGRLVAQGGTLVESMTGAAIDRVASTADLGLLADGCLTARQIENHLHDLQKLPPMPPVADRVDLCERLSFLDTTLAVARGGWKAVETFGGANRPPPAIQDLISRLGWSAIDWDPALRSGNRWYGRLAAALRIRDRAAREKALHELRTSFAELRVNVLQNGGLDRSLAKKDGGKALGQAVGDILLSLQFPAASKVYDASQRAEQILENLRVAFALAAYRADHGRYPKTLAPLAPRYLARVPEDRFSGKPLVYRPSGKGYLLYSVGVNGKDADGRGPDDDPPGDDLSVRMPLPELPGK